MPGFKTKEQSRIETLETQINEPHSEQEKAEFARIKLAMMEYLTRMRDDNNIDVTVQEFVEVAKKMTSAELKGWAMQKGISQEIITVIAGNMLAFLADANRYGYGWDDLFNE